MKQEIWYTAHTQKYQNTLISDTQLRHRNIFKWWPLYSNSSVKPLISQYKESFEIILTHFIFWALYKDMLVFSCKTFWASVHCILWDFMTYFLPTWSRMSILGNFHTFSISWIVGHAKNKQKKDVKGHKACYLYITSFKILWISFSKIFGKHLTPKDTISTSTKNHCI